MTTPRFSAGQNKMRLIAVFLFTVLLVLVFQLFRGISQGASPVAESGAQAPKATMSAAKLDPNMFMGLRKASPGEIHQVMPAAKGKPTLIEFHSRLCHDCKRMAPVLAKVMPEYPQVYYRKFDILEDKDAHPAIFRIFKPMSVPMLVFVNERGEIRNVLYNYQSAETIRQALQQLKPALKAGQAAD